MSQQEDIARGLARAAEEKMGEETQLDMSRINRVVIGTLAFVLVFGVVAEIGLGGASWFRAAGDPSGVNSVHDFIKSTITYVLGAFSGIVQARIVGRAV